MKYLYLIIFDDDLSNLTQLQKSIKRYLKYLLGEVIEVKAFDHLNFKNSLSESEGLSAGSEISFHFISFNRILSEAFKKNYNFVDVNSHNVYEWKGKIKALIYSYLVQSFKHGAKFDLVNSELGLLNVYCIYENNQQFSLSKSEIESCKKLLNKIKVEFTLEKNLEKYYPELMLIKYYVEQIRSILNDNNFKKDENKLDTIKNYFKYIFKFVSEYKEKE